MPLSDMWLLAGHLRRRFSCESPFGRVVTNEQIRMAGEYPTPFRCYAKK
jgi:hypothetical protein